MMPGTHRDALTVERRTNVLAPESVEHEREHASFLARGPDETKTRHAGESTSCVDEEIVLIALHVFDADPLHVVERRPEPDRVRDIVCARLEPPGRLLIERLLERDVP